MTFYHAQKNRQKRPAEVAATVAVAAVDDVIAAAVAESPCSAATMSGGELMFNITAKSIMAIEDESVHHNVRINLTHVYYPWMLL